MKTLAPGSMLGVLGGGQLGAMFAGAARRMGYHIAVWDPDPDAPAHRLASSAFSSPFSDPLTREKFSQMVQAVTFEWENVPAELCEWLERDHPVRPASSVLRVIQDRIEQKRFFQSFNLSVPPFVILQSAGDLASAIKTLGLPAICKTAKTGYDGKGQWIIREMSETAQVEAALKVAKPGMRWILESFIQFERELSVVVVRGADGECRSYPVAENRHEQGILRFTLVPAAIPSDAARQAAELATRAVVALNGIGVYCVELFQRPGGDLLINEVAPRPHNSGHYTLEACSVSQFEQQVRIVSGLPLGEVRLVSAAAMVNLIGDDVDAVTTSEGTQALLSVPGAVLHLYGKRVVRPGRKMGHVTFLADQAELAAQRATQFMSTLA
jgi:5-(carboxyamino)imidazole ribonucleotide synthase